MKTLTTRQANVGQYGASTSDLTDINSAGYWANIAKDAAALAVIEGTRAVKYGKLSHDWAVGPNGDALDNATDTNNSRYYAYQSAKSSDIANGYAVTAMTYGQMAHDWAVGPGDVYEIGEPTDEDNVYHYYIQVKESIDKIADVDDNIEALESYRDIAHDWAVSDEEVDDGIHEVDYSSKYYAGESKESLETFEETWYGNSETFPETDKVGAAVYYSGINAKTGMYVYTGEESSVNNGWVFMSVTPPQQSGIIIGEYTFEDEGNSFTIEKYPETLVVHLDSVIQSPSNYTYSPNSPSLVEFPGEVIPAGSHIIYEAVYATDFVANLHIVGKDTADNIYDLDTSGINYGDAWLITEEGTYPENSDWVTGQFVVWGTAGQWVNFKVETSPNDMTEHYYTALSDLEEPQSSITLTLDKKPLGTGTLFRNGAIQNTEFYTVSQNLVHITDETSPFENGEELIFIYSGE